ncbi:Bifunctional polymyxin resistance protein ArnA [Rosistilla ulvae]|uniref:UDP-glucuronate decarboxylase n=1 Tax=Rosistilla ulvae TaxID=1930277 RepID=A0A517LZV2_9BACT|nr:GDP-mannose 4,6-dehydratase [Rosistilla ulvae]QDS88157.1 Bifunctional polymyxin resistance protein ArnA [Rosistilla ulvae]
MPKRALITGGAGFIGSHLAEQLLAAGMQVTIVDDLSTGRFENIAGLESRSDVEIIIDTVFNESLIADLIQKSDVVYHLASAVGVKLIIDQPVKTIETIVGGTEIVLRHCSRFRRPVLITSTSEVYGKGSKIPFHEDDDLVTGATSRHRWAYACSKTLDEFLALAHHRETHLPVAIVRLFNTVGPRQTGQYGMVVPNFVQAALKGNPLVVHGDGNQCRCFAHVADVVGALVKIMSNADCYGQVVNIGNNEEVSINQLAQRVIQWTGSTSEIQHIAYDEAYGDGFEDMQRRVPCLQRAADLIGYQPTRDLEKIIRDVADSFSA